jgi:hypothetical protein
VVKRTAAVALLVLLLAIVTTPGSGQPATAATSTTGCTVSATLVPSCGAFFGSTLNLLRGQANDTAMLGLLERMWGRNVTVIHQYETNADPFPTPAQVAWTSDPTHPRALAINWKPATQVTWAAIANGAVDARLDAEAARLVAYGRPMLLAINHEPEDQVVDAAGSGMRPEDYVAMFRHVVTRLRADGATKVAFVWDMMGYKGWGVKGWYDRLYPGDAYVDWIAADMYGSDLATMLTRTGPNWPGWYAWATTQHPGKPLAMFEFGMPNPRMTVSDEATAYDTVTKQLPAFPALRLLLHFNHGVDGVTQQDCRYDDDPTTIYAFTSMVRQPSLNPVLPVAK